MTVQSANRKGKKSKSASPAGPKPENKRKPTAAPPDTDGNVKPATSQDEKPKATPAEQLVNRAMKVDGLQLFCGDLDGNDCYASVPCGDHAKTLSIKSIQFRRWLTQLQYGATGKVPNSDALQAAINVFAAEAQYRGNIIETHIRVAAVDGAIWIDLCDPTWRAVCIDAVGWRLVQDPPVRFVRQNGMQPLPVPAMSGSVDELREFVNLRDDASWRMYVAWIIGSFMADAPMPILNVDGEQGSGKTSACKIARMFTDPNKGDLRRPPREDRDLMIAAKNSWVVGYDNISSLPPWLSDSLCSLATGGSFGVRQHYSNDEEIIFSARRPIIVNGIADVASRPDLQDRCVSISMPTISHGDYIDEDSLYRRLHEARPRILGAIYSVVSAALRARRHVQLHGMPRMADFAKWMQAAETALGWPAGSFMTDYTANRGESMIASLELSAIGPAIRSMMRGVSEWTGNYQDLLDRLNQVSDEATRRRRDWPESPRKLAGDLSRLAPCLRKTGIDVQVDKKTGTGRPVRITKSVTSSAENELW